MDGVRGEWTISAGTDARYVIVSEVRTGPCKFVHFGMAIHVPGGITEGDFKYEKIGDIREL